MLNNILLWTQRFRAVSVLCSQFPDDYRDAYSQYPLLIAVGNNEPISTLEELQKTRDACPDWMFGHIAYDYKNRLERLTTRGADRIGFEEFGFFVPDMVITLEEELIAWTISQDNEDLKELLGLLKEMKEPKSKQASIILEAQFSKQGYLEKIDRIKKHLQQGDIYEMNYCVEFAGEGQDFLPEHFFYHMLHEAKAPFSAFYKMEDKYLMCASPERYLAKRGRKLISQPIKGTRRRHQNPEVDEKLKAELAESPKERSENVMIVDLVRNDLSRIAARNSVVVEELFGVYSFPAVHQLISTVACEMDDKKNFSDAIRATFPMGSMTGAPKIRAMQLIDELEDFARGLYSGTGGYISPDGDFDFNVVIRSLQYNRENKVLSLKVGGAITIASQAEEEYQECLTKAHTIRTLLKGEIGRTLS